MLLLLISLALTSWTLFGEVLDPIEVKAEKNIKRFSFGQYQVISDFKLDQQPLGLISTELEKIPGVIATQNGGPGGRVSFFIRGTEARHLSFTLDGLRINDPSNTDRQFDAAYLTSSFIKEVTIYKGPQAVLFGPDAMGGVVELKTKKGEEGPGTSVKISGGSFGTISSSLQNNWQNKNQAGTLTLTRFHTSGMSRLNKKRFNAQEKDSSDITQITSSSNHPWAEKIETDFLAQYSHARAQQDGILEDTSDNWGIQDQYLVQQKTDLSLNESQSVSLRNGFNRYQRWIRDQNEENFFNGELTQHELVHRFEEGGWGLLSGFSHERESIKLSSLDRFFDLNSFFLQSSFEKKSFKVQAGGRFDHHSRYGAFFTGSGGIQFEEFQFQYSRGYKAPSLYQLYGPSIFGFPVGNENLVPEVNHSFEVGWKRNSELFESSLTLFQNRLSNLFYYSPLEGYLNQQRFIAEGVELSGKLITSKFNFLSNFTHQQFKNEKVPVLRRPYNSLQLGVSHFPTETLELNLSSRWFSSRQDVQAKLNPYEVVDLSLIKSWPQDEIVVQLRNLLQREYEDLYGYSVLPRSIFASYLHRF